MRLKIAMTAVALLLTIAMLAGCSSVSSIGSTAETAVATTTTETAAEDAVAQNTDFEGDHDDPADYEWDAADEIAIVLDGDSITTDASGATTDGGTIRLTEAGTYRISGALDDGQIVVDTVSEETVRLVLDDVDITCSDSSPIYVASAEKVVVILEDGTQNTLSDGSEYVLVDAEEGEPNAALFSKSDLTIGGSGSLTVAGNYSDGIVSKDGLVINMQGEVVVDAVDDGIRGTDYIVVKDGALDVAAVAKGLKSSVAIVIEGGDIDVTSADDAIHSNGSVAISDGALTLASGDDGVHADIDLYVSGGTIDITESYEGLESATITVDGGDISIVSSDDGLNVAGGNDGSGETTADGSAGGDTFGGRPGGGGGGMETPGDYFIFINGGTIAIDAEGDGIDSNGYIEMTGGTVVVHGTTGLSNRAEGAIDYNGSFELSGGTLVATDDGSRESKTVDALVDQAAIRMTVDGVVSAGTLVHLESEDGESVLTFEAAKSFSALLFSSPDLVAGTEYDVYFDGTASGTSIAGLYDSDAYEPGSLAGTLEAFE